ncbi:MAG TPA: ethanolamine utilization protein EutJ [Alcanivorax sp.]|jgi:branched-chain amino acid transport system substrate-binding protein|nr:ABC transporter substrate-binding protein [Alcanivorax sp.]HCJ63550.1 ethanolamine utilization protein EutJ [Alcanivorax sp.]
MKVLKSFRRLAAASAVALAIGGAAHADEVNIGFTGPLSGGAALYGENTLEGLRMAAEEINAAGGITVDGEEYTINIQALDDKYSPSQAAVNGKRLVQQYNAPVIFTPHSGGTFALQAFNERDGFLVMSYTSVPAVTSKGNKLTVKIPPNFTDYIEPFSRITMDRFGNKLGVANATHDYAKYWTKEFVPVWRELGGEVAAMNPMDYNKSADFYTGVSKVLSEDPDVMFVGGASEPTGLVVRQARELGFKGGFILMDQAKMDEVAKVSGGIKSLEGSVGVVPLDKYENEGAKLFLEKWQKDHNGVATSETAYNYFAMYLIAQAMQEAGTVDDAKAIRAAIGSAMEKVSVEHNPYDVDGIDEAGNLGADPQIAEVVDGEVVLRKLSEITE